MRNFELYEALKRDLNDEAARMIAEVVPAADELATKADVERSTVALRTDFQRLEAATKADVERSTVALRTDFQRLEAATTAEIEGLRVDLERYQAATAARFERLGAAMEAGFTGLDQKIDQRIAEVETKFVRWTMTFFVPMWLSILGSVVAIVLKA